MPVVSQAQRRWAYATAEGKTDTDPKVGQEFIDKSHGITGLPDRVSNSRHPELSSLASRHSTHGVDDLIFSVMKRGKR